MSYIILLVVIVFCALLLKVLVDIRNEFVQTRKMLETTNERMLLQNEQTENALKNIYTDITMYLKSTPPAPAEPDPEELYEDAKEAVIESGHASASFLQRSLHIGYAKAAKLLDMLEERDIIGPGEGAKPREILVDKELE